MSKPIYAFSSGNQKMKNLIGGKGANLCEMTKLGLPIPPGFIFTTEVCLQYLKDQKWPQSLDVSLRKNIQEVEKQLGKKFGEPKNPMFFSVRSGARVSMPGMMDTVLNLGLNDKTLPGLIRWSGKERFAWDAYRRFVNIFADVVLGIKARSFEEILHRLKTEKNISLTLICKRKT